MQSTIDGIEYNTASGTSFEIAHFTDGRQRGDPLHVFEVLYRTGQSWFLHRRRGGVETIVPLTPKRILRLGSAREDSPASSPDGSATARANPGR